MSLQNKLRIWGRTSTGYLKGFTKRHWKGTGLIAALTLLFFAPLLPHVGSYDVGGDASFNAWTLARGHHCILRQGCPDITDANIYFPNSDTFLYSETQLSAALLTLPLHFINPNPLFAYNVWTIASFFLSAWFMYLLARRLSRGMAYSSLFSVLAGLIFAFAPFKIAAIFHLQNLSIFYVPLALLLVMKFVDTGLRRYVALLAVVMSLLFYASWVQAVFGVVAVVIFAGGLWLTKLINWKKLGLIAAAIAVAAVTVLPLAREYMRFSREKNAEFSIADQLLYSSSVADYFIPYKGTLWGNLYYQLRPDGVVNAYNMDSYSYHGLVLYAIAATLIIGGFVWYRRHKKDKAKPVVSLRTSYKYAAIAGVMGVVGFLASLGPLLKIKGNFEYGTVAEGTDLVFPAPWMIVDLVLPQLSFIRAIGRASVLTLLALCILLALLPVCLQAARKLSGRAKQVIVAVVTILVIVELAPMHFYPMANKPFNYSPEIPAVYTFIKQRDDINNIVILRSEENYKGAPIEVARPEDVRWAGYHNKNIFNGYSGYTPPLYFETFWDFVFFKADDIDKMKKLGLKYILIDKQLSTNMPLYQDVSALLPDKVYEDKRYALFKIK